ncbi:MAG: hypothetical protein MMC33_000777 [Icmadophila ericetorum]|nr:hypothetical protein [Icmadophila ericetorum]
MLSFVSYDFITVMEGGYPGQCTSSLSAGQVISYYYNPFSLSSGPSTWILTTGSVTEVTSLAGVQVNGYIFSTTSTTSALLTPTPLSKSTPQSSGIPSSGVTVTSLLPTQTILPSRTTSALSTGRIVGIASGVITFFYGFMILTYILIRRSRRKAKQAALSSTLQSRADDFRRSANDQGQKSELPVNEPVLELADRKNLWHELG